MKKASLNVTVREAVGTAAAKKQRREAFIPGVVYRKGKTSTNILMEKKDILKVLHTKAGGNVLIDLHVKDSAKESSAKTVIIKEIQHDHLKGEIIHVDFQQILLTERIKINVPVVITGEARGVREGGVLEYVMREIEVECLPAKIPEKVQVDVSGLDIGKMVHVKELSFPEDVKVLSEPEQVVLLVKAREEEKVEVAPAEAAPLEPEVIKQKKPEEIVEEKEVKKKEKE